MKKILLIISGLCLITVSLSISYYFVIFLPQKEQINEAKIKKIEQQTSDIKQSVENMPAPVFQDNTDIQQKLDDMRQEQQDERQNENNCESNGGRYQGNGTCVYY